MVDKTYTLYMDQYGNFIGAELYSGQDQYVFITGYDRPQSNISVSTAKAAAIFTDGTMAAIDVNVKDTNSNIQAYNNRRFAGVYTEANCDYIRWGETHSGLKQMGHASNADGNPYENMWYKYTLKDSVYTLSPVDNYTRDVNTSVGDEKTINCTNVRLVVVPTPATGDTDGVGTGRSYGEDESVYITVDDGDVDRLPTQAITEVTGRYTGVQNVNLIYQPGCWANAVYNDEGFIVAAVIYGEAEGVVDNYAYIRSGAKNEKIEADGTHYWDFDAIMNGELVTKTIKSRFANTVNTPSVGAVQELVLDADGYVTTIKNLKNVDPSGEDEVYNNPDFNSTSDANAGILDDYEVYDIVINGTLTGADAVPGTNPTRYMIGMSHSGRTLHYSRDEEDIGLDFVRDAKAVVRQTINNESKWTAYTGEDAVHTAFNTLMDADGVTSNNNQNGVTKQFSGRIVAVLNAQGVAEWVFFDDYTPVRSSDPNYSTSVSGTRVTPRTPVAEVRELLKTGNVIVTGTWLPSDTVNPAGAKLLTIPAGRTLKIEGDFDSTAQDDVLIDAIDSSSKPDVTGKFTVDYTTSPSINYTVAAGSMDINNTSATTISAPMTITGDLDVTGTTTNLTIARGVTVRAGSVTGTPATDKITVNGTLIVDGILAASADVYSVSTLKAGTLASGATVTVGDGTSSDKNGRAEITTLKGNLVVDNTSTAVATSTVGTVDGTGKVTVTNGSVTITNVDITTPANDAVVVNGGTATITTVTSGKVDVNNTATVTVATAKKDAYLDIDSSAKATVTKELDTSKVAVAAGGTVSLNSGVTLGSNSKVTVNGVEADGKLSGAATITAPGGGIANDAALPITGEDTTAQAKNPFVAQPTTPAEAEAMIENAMKAMAPAVTLNLEQTWTPGTGDGTAADKSKGTLSLKGQVMRLTKANLTGGMIHGYCAFTDWDSFVNGAAAGTSPTGANGYNLLNSDGSVKEFGFVVVKIGNADYEMLVVRNADTKKFEMVTRTEGGVLEYHAPRIRAFNGVYYTIDLSGLY